LFTEEDPIVGRQLQHYEDLIIVEGAPGALKAINELMAIANGSESMTIKWDGSAAIYFGRDKRGNFYLAPQAQWKKLVVKKDDIRSSLISTPKKKEDSEDEHNTKRSYLADMYDKLSDIVEKATPEDINSFYKADIIFYEKPNKIDGRYEFTPNKVTYSVSLDGFFGKMKTAEAMIAVHGSVKNIGETEINPISQDTIKKLDQDPELIVVGSISASTRNVDEVIISQLKDDMKAVNASANSINLVVNWQAEGYMNTAFRKDLYSYSVAFGKANGNIQFIDWLKESNVSEIKKQKIMAFIKLRTREWKLFLSCHSRIYNSKIRVFDQINKEYSTVLGVKQTVNGKPGGEGFVSASGNKIVNPNFRAATHNPKFKR